MNIFKVIASGKKSFAEEQMSSVLAWLLHPKMEHGLGYQVLERFLKAIGINDISIKHGFRDITDTISCALELYVEGEQDKAFIDIVYFIEDYVIAIENKIYSGSVSDGQLIREYNGLKKQFDGKRLLIVYLTPDEMCAKQEFEQLQTDNKVLITWRETICSIVEGILADEAIGNVEPIPEYTRHTLKALCAFIKNDFEGYDYNKALSSGGNNPLAQGRYSVNDLKKKTTGFVGVQHGLAGLIRLNRSVLTNMKFQYTEIDMSNKNNWLSLSEFINLTEWLLYNKEPNFTWDAKLDALSIYKIVNRMNNSKIYIGIQGGEDALLRMDNNSILNKRWGIKTDCKPKSQWIRGERYRQICIEKGLWVEDIEINNIPKIVIETINAFVLKYKCSRPIYILESHPCSEQYNCIDVGFNQKEYFSFNIGGSLHIFSGSEHSIITDYEIKTTDELLKEIEKVIF